MKLVVAYYNEDISWLYKVPEHWDIFVYCKKRVPPSSLSRVSWIPLENKHRESGTFLHHIIKNYHSLDDLTLFCQGWPFDHCKPFFDVLDSKNIYEINKAMKKEVGNAFVYRPDLGYVGLGRPCLFHYEERLSEIKKWSKVSQRWEVQFSNQCVELWNFVLREKLPNVTETHWGGQFAVTKEAVQFFPSQFYINLMDLHRANSSMPWAMEHVFPEAFLRLREKYLHYHKMI